MYDRKWSSQILENVEHVIWFVDIAHANQHAQSSSAPHVPLENPQFGMPMNYTPSQAPLAINMLTPKPDDAMVLSPPMVEPLIIFFTLVSTSQNVELLQILYHLIAELHIVLLQSHP
jgi:hypothetical protein